MFLINVRFQRYDRNAFDITEMHGSGSTYTYLSDKALEENTVVIVPIYSDTKTIKMARVIDCTSITSGVEHMRNGHTLRHIVDVVDIDSYMQRRQRAKDAARARAMIEEAARSRSFETLYAEVRAMLPAEQQQFIEQALGLSIETKPNDSPGESRKVQMAPELGAPYGRSETL